MTRRAVRRYLETLREELEQLNAIPASEITALMVHFQPLMHKCMLVWRHSRHYNTPARLVVLFREICNALIAKAREYMDCNDIFVLPPNESLGRLLTTLKVGGPLPLPRARGHSPRHTTHTAR